MDGSTEYDLLDGTGRHRADVIELIHNPRVVGSIPTRPTRSEAISSVVSVSRAPRFVTSVSTLVSAHAYDDPPPTSRSTTRIGRLVRHILGAMAGMTLTELRDRRDEIVEIARARGASRVRVFGSVARGEAIDGSDVDFLVDLEPGHSLLDLGGLLMNLQDLVDRNVDVVTERGLRPGVAQRVLADAVEL